MKKKNGFTLIELLAVIVILVIIVLIAVPQILNILNKARLNAAKDSTYGIVKAAETYATNFMLENNGSLPNEDLVFNCSSYGCILENNLENYNTENLDKLDFKGTKPTSGKITISDNGRIIKGEDLIINNFRCNYDKEVSCGSVDESEIPTPPTVLITPTATSNQSGYSQNKEVAINFTGDGTYLVMSTKDVTTNVEAITCRDVIDASFTCDGDAINTNGTLLANIWYKVENKPTLTLEENGSIYYKVSDGTNYKDGGSITITEIDTTAPIVASVTQKSATTNSITVEAIGTDEESGISAYQFSIDGGEWLPSTPQTSKEYTFNGVTSGNHQIKARVINGTYTNNGQNDNNTTESNNITMAPGELAKPEITSSPEGYSQSKTVTIDYKSSAGTYLVKPTMDVTTNIVAKTCSSVNNGMFNCNGDNVLANGKLLANTWYKVESNPTITFTSNGSVAYQVSDGTNYKDGGSITITEIDTTAPIVASVTQKSATTNSITVTASGTDSESGIVRYQFSIDEGSWQPSTPQEENEYTFNGVTSGDHSIKTRVINGTYTNNGQNELNTTESSSVIMEPLYIKLTSSSSMSGHPTVTNNNISFSTSPNSGILYFSHYPAAFNWSIYTTGSGGGSISFCNKDNVCKSIVSVGSGVSINESGSYVTTEPGYIRAGNSGGVKIDINNITLNNEIVSIIHTIPAPSISTIIVRSGCISDSHGNITSCEMEYSNGSITESSIVYISRRNGGGSNYQIKIDNEEWQSLPYVNLAINLSTAGTHYIKVREYTGNVFGEESEPFVITIQ